MEKMLSKILEVDKKSREELEKVKQIHLESEKKSNEALKQKRIDYINRAKENIKKLEKEEKIKAYVKLRHIEHKYKNILKKINENYEKNKNTWVDEIVEKVI